MKVLFYTTFFIFVLLLPYNPAFCQKSKLSHYDSTGIMPSFRFYLPDGTVFTPDSLNKKNITILIYFKTDCPFCGQEADIISKNSNDFQSADFIFISGENASAIKYFAAKYKLDKNNNVKFLVDNEKLYNTYYSANYTPSIHIYDKNRKLKLFTEHTLSKRKILKHIH